MRRTRLHDGWSVRPRLNPFAEMGAGGSAWEPVTVPHDAMIGGTRSPDSSAASGYFVGGTWEYRRLLDVPDAAAGSTMTLELEGAYRDAVVLVNGTIAAKRPYGYSNAIRSAHNPISKAMLRPCDRLGVLVMDETFDVWDQQKSDDDYALRFPDWWEADVEAMVRKDVNHPSVILYSIGNEIPDGSTPSGLHIGRALADKVRSPDDTRFVTQAVTAILVAGPEIFAEVRASFAETSGGDEAGVNTVALSLADIMGQALQSPIVAEKTVEAFSHLDVAGYNYMDTRYAIDAELYPNRVVVSTESYASTMDQCWEGVTVHPNVIGDFTWTGWDYLGEAGVGRVEHGDEASGLGMSAFHGSYPSLTAGCADIDISGNRRPQSYYREIVWGLSAGPYLAVERPENHDRTLVHASPWAWTDVVSDRCPTHPDREPEGHPLLGPQGPPAERGRARRASPPAHAATAEALRQRWLRPPREVGGGARQEPPCHR